MLQLVENDTQVFKRINPTEQNLATISKFAFSFDGKH